MMRGGSSLGTRPRHASSFHSLAQAKAIAVPRPKLATSHTIGNGRRLERIANRIRARESAHASIASRPNGSTGCLAIGILASRSVAAGSSQAQVCIQKRLPSPRRPGAVTSMPFDDCEAGPEAVARLRATSRCALRRPRAASSPSPIEAALGLRRISSHLQSSELLFRAGSSLR